MKGNWWGQEVVGIKRTPELVRQNVAVKDNEKNVGQVNGKKLKIEVVTTNINEQIREMRTPEGLVRVLCASGRCCDDWGIMSIN
jgi:hypothetical protein